MDVVALGYVPDVAHDLAGGVDHSAWLQPVFEYSTRRWLHQASFFQEAFIVEHVLEK